MVCRQYISKFQFGHNPPGVQSVWVSVIDQSSSLELAISAGD
jgi:hypothetical protein